MQRSLAWLAVGALALSALVATGWQRQQIMLARIEAARLHDLARDRARLEAENDRLQRSQLSEHDVAQLRDDAQTASRLRAELGALRGRPR
jgi:hypothetical protein